MEEKKKESRVPWYALAVGILFVALCVSVTMKFLSQARVANDALIADHVQKLQQIFERINKTCKITGFRHAKDHIDFLNVIAFAGTVVGPMNVLEPNRWEGPYVDESLTMNGKEYQILRTKNGYYIVPGDGVKLSNGKIIGKTLMITPSSNIERMMRDPHALMSNNRSLAVRIQMHQNVFERLDSSDFLDEEIEMTA